MDDKKTNGKKGLSSVAELRKRARQHIEDGAVTPDYRGDVTQVVKMLNEALATELVCVLRYRRHYFMAQGIHSQAVADEFLEHSNEEQGHADMIAARIVQLDGEPDFNPDSLTKRSHAEYVEGTSLSDMIKENLIAERVAIESYAEMIQVIGMDDPTTRRMLEEILAKEEEHAEDLGSLVQQAGRDENINDRTSTNGATAKATPAPSDKPAAKAEPRS